MGLVAVWLNVDLAGGVLATGDGGQHGAGVAAWSFLLEFLVCSSYLFPLLYLIATLFFPRTDFFLSFSLD